MIAGFEEQTHKLTDVELLAIPIILGILNERYRQNPIKNKAIALQLLAAPFTDGGGRYFEPSRIRKIINHISIKKLTVLPLVANSHGYYITNDKDDIKRYQSSLLSRIDAIRARHKAIQEWY